MELGLATMSSSSSPNIPLVGARDEETNLILNHVVEIFPRTAHMQQLLAKKMEEERQQRAEEEAQRLLQLKEEMERRQKDEEYRKRKQQKKKLRDIEDKKRREEEMKNRDDDSLSQLLRMCLNNEAPEAISFSGLGLKEVQLRVLVRDGLARNNTIVALDLRRAGLTDDTGPTIAQMLHTNTCLRKLTLEGNHLGLASAKAFKKALEVNHTLRSLDVENCNFTCRGVAQAGVEELAKGLRANRGLLNLNLRNNQIDDEGGDALLEAMATNTTLIQLDVSGNDLPMEQLRELQLVVDRNRARFTTMKTQERHERAQMAREEELMKIFLMQLEAQRVSIEGAERRRIAREKERFESWMERTEADEREQDELIQTLQKGYEDRKAALTRRKKGSKKKGQKKSA